MSGVRGDVFALSTWRKHTIVTLKNRGLIQGAKVEAVVGGEGAGEDEGESEQGEGAIGDDVRAHEQ